MRKLYKQYKTWRSFRRSRQELEALSDDALKDIGLTRDDIRYAIKRGSRRIDV